MVPRDVIADIPGEVLGDDWLGVNRELNTVVLHRTNVLCQYGTEVRTYRDGHRVQQVGGLTIVAIEAGRDAVVEETEVETCVPCSRCLPFQVWVVGIRTHGVVVCATEGVLGIRVTDDIERGVAEVATDILLTSLTPAEAELELIPPCEILHELLFVDLPGQCHRGEVAPVVVLRELRGTIGTERCRQHVAVEQRVVQTTEVRNQRVVSSPLLLTADAGLEGLAIVGVSTLSLIETVTVVVAFLGTGHDVDEVSVELLLILGVCVGGDAVLVVACQTVPAIVVVGV